MSEIQQLNLLKSETDSMFTSSTGTSGRICNMDDTESLLSGCVNVFEIGERATWQGKALMDTPKGKNIFI